MSWLRTNAGRYGLAPGFLPNVRTSGLASVAALADIAGRSSAAGDARVGVVVSVRSRRHAAATDGLFSGRISVTVR